MKDKNEIGITVKKADDMPEWYSQVCLKAELADYSAVKGVPVMRPLGYGLWQSIMEFFNKQIKEMGVENAYFPLFIPESFIKKEAEHVQGFAPELAWIEQKSKDEERVCLRPTSETIMYDSYAKWIRSHRDLPLRINQWANVIRWEVSDVKLFLRGREFLWQEGHCVYATEEETDKEVRAIIEKYKQLSEELLAIPAYIGLKTKKETFAGAKYTYTIEQFMPDGKALQSGTSHNLGQGFAKAFGISFQGQDGKEHTPWQSSWGFSTRLLGAIVMVHGDDKGLVLPPRMAPVKAVVVPIITKKETRSVLEKARDVANRLDKQSVTTRLDDRQEYSPGFKFSEWELKGVPLRIEIGPRDLANGTCVVVKRNTGEKMTVAFDDVPNKVSDLLATLQQELFDTAKKRVEENMAQTNDYDEFMKLIQQRKFVLAPHCGKEDCEDDIKAQTGGATTRCRPDNNDQVKEGQQCIRCEEKAAYKVIFAKNY